MNTIGNWGKFRLDSHQSHEPDKIQIVPLDSNQKSPSSWSSGSALLQVLQILFFSFKVMWPYLLINHEERGGYLPVCSRRLKRQIFSFTIKKKELQKHKQRGLGQGTTDSNRYTHPLHYTKIHCNIHMFCLIIVQCRIFHCWWKLGGLQQHTSSSSNSEEKERKRSGKDPIEHVFEGR